MLKKDPGAPDGVRAPLAGEIMRNPTLAQTFRTLAEEGKKGFYTGRVAEAIVKVCTDLGGHLELGDLEHHLQVGSEPVEPISLTFGGQGLEEDGKKAGVALWEHPPNGQGIVALMALGILRELELQGKIPTWASDDFNTAPYLHAIIESLRIAFADGNWWIADPNVSKLPVAELVSEPYLRERAKLFSADKASPLLRRGDPAEVSPALRSSDTVYFAVSDRDGNACSFINSNFMGFGTGIIPAGCGFTLQNRGTGFVIGGAARAGGGHHPNALGPRKRPYHTIIPGLATNLRDGSLHSVFGVMGGYMQPQGHVQVLLGQLVGGLNPQQALDAPRVCVGPGFPGQEDDAYDMTVSVEEGMGEEAVEGLRRLGHKVAVVTGMGRAMFGRGQIIRWTVDEVEGIGVWSAGSDMRGDGAAFPA
jgi:gamma-glutamyltranspeptidase/glutathione hydrolase